MNIAISQRLLTIARAVPDGCRLADIGTDHAWLPIYLRIKKIIPQAIAVDITAKPLAVAAQNIANCIGSNSAIELRLGDGLSVINEGEVDVVVMAGMGGLRIQNIISARLEICQHVDRLILQPNTNWAELRQFLWSSGFSIIEENMLEERGQFFLTLVVSAGEQVGTIIDAVGGIELRHRPSEALDNWLIKRQETLRGIQDKNVGREMPKVEERLSIIQTLITQRANHNQIP